SMSSKPKYTRIASKIRPVPINLMRTPPALVTQRPLKKSFVSWLASHLDLNKLGFPIINHRDQGNWICDGQHPVEALSNEGFKEDNLDCEVYENLTDDEMAEIFLGRDDRRAINAFDKFHVACTANRQRECDIRRAVESQGAKVSRMRESNCISAVS